MRPHRLRDTLVYAIDGWAGAWLAGGLVPTLLQGGRMRRCNYCDRVAPSRNGGICSRGMGVYCECAWGMSPRGDENAIETEE